MASNWEPKTLVDLAQRHWHKPIGLLFSLAAAVSFEIFLLKSIKASGITTIIVYSITTIFFIIAWFYSNRFPKTPKGKVGFVVCIQFSNEDEKKVIRGPNRGCPLEYWLPLEIGIALSF